MSMTRPSILVGAFLVLAPASLAVPQVWVEHLATPKPEEMSDASPDGAGGAFVLGETSGSLAAPQQVGWDVYAARFSAAGDLAWQVQFGAGASNDRGDSIVGDGTGGCFVGCTTHGLLGAPPAGFADAAVLRIDASGNFLWAVQFGTPQWEENVRVAPDGTGGVFVGYDFGSSGGWDGVRDVRLMRLDAAGAVLWSQTFGAAGADWIGDLIADGSGGFYACGRTRSNIARTTAGGHDGWLARVDANGGFQWLVQMGTSADDSCEQLALLGPDELYLVGSTHGPLAGSHFGGEDVFVARYDGSGSGTWVRQFGGEGWDHPLGIAPDGLDGVFLVGTTDGELFAPHAGGQDAWMAQVRSDGTVAWGQQMGTSGEDAARAVCASAPGSFVLAGDSTGPLFGAPTLGTSDMFVALYEACGFDAPQAYCPGSSNSTGAPAVLVDQGSTSIGLNDLRFSVAGGPPGEKGIVILGTQQAQNPFGNGTLCLGGSVQRLLPPVTLSAEGKGIHQVDFEDPTQPTAQITPGSTWYFQFWYRDSAAGIGDFNLSNGLSATFCP
jgi:hypothetical protein